MKPILAEELLVDGGWKRQPIFIGVPTSRTSLHQWMHHEHVGSTNWMLWDIKKIITKKQCCL